MTFEKSGRSGNVDYMEDPDFPLDTAVSEEMETHLKAGSQRELKTVTSCHHMVWMNHSIR